MRKVFVAFAILLGMTSVSQAKWSKDEFSIGPSGSCFVDTFGVNAFWYCGKQSKGCNSKAHSSSSKEIWMKDGDILDSKILQQGETDIEPSSITWLNWICCGGTDSAQGVFKENKTTTKAKILGGGGTCKQTLNGCGTVTEDCDTIDTCNDGSKAYTKTDGKKVCIKICPTGQGVTEANTQLCIDCPTGMTQGVNSSRSRRTARTSGGNPED